MTKIIVNAKEYEVTSDTLTYEELHDMAFPQHAGRRPIPVLSCVYSARIGHEIITGIVHLDRPMPVREGTHVSMAYTG